MFFWIVFSTFGNLVCYQSDMCFEFHVESLWLLLVLFFVEKNGHRFKFRRMNKQQKSGRTLFVFCCLLCVFDLVLCSFHGHSCNPFSSVVSPATWTIMPWPKCGCHAEKRENYPVWILLCALFFSLSLVFGVFVQVQITSVVVQKSYCSSKHEMGENFPTIPVPICRSNTFWFNRNWTGRGIFLPGFCAHVLSTRECENQLDILMQVFNTDRWWHLAKDVHRFYVFLAIICCVSACSNSCLMWLELSSKFTVERDFWHKLRRLAEKSRVLCVDSGCRMLWIREQTQSIFRLRKQCLPNTHQIMRPRSKQHSITGVSTVVQLVSIVSMPNCAWGGNLVFPSVSTMSSKQRHPLRTRWVSWPATDMKMLCRKLGNVERFMRWIFVS